MKMFLTIQVMDKTTIGDFKVKNLEDLMIF